MAIPPNLAVPLRVDLPSPAQDQLLGQGEKIGTVALGVLLAADVGVIAGRGQQRCRQLDACHDLHAGA